MSGIYKDNSAVSETIGFVIIFAIVLTCIGIILMYGNSVLDSAKSQNNFQSIQQGFTVLQGDMAQVALQQTPAKTTMIHLEDGTVAYDPTKGALTVNDNNDPTINLVTGTLNYTSSSSPNILSIENGGLWMHYQAASDYEVISSPRIYAIPDSTNASNLNTLVLNVIKLNGTKQASGGPRTLNVKMKYDSATVNTYVLQDGSHPYGRSVTISYTTSHPNAWQAFLNDGNSTAQADMYGNSLYGYSTAIIQSGNQVSATISNVETLIITVHTVDINFY